MPAPHSVRLLTIMESAMMLDPFLKPTNAMNWLADMRRTTSHYRNRGVIPPICVKHNGVWHYPVEEVERVIDELKTAKRRKHP